MIGTFFCKIYFPTQNVTGWFCKVLPQFGFIIPSIYINCLCWNCAYLLAPSKSFLIDGYDDQPFCFSLAVGTIGGLALSVIPIFLFLPIVMRLDGYFHCKKSSV